MSRDVMKTAAAYREFYDRLGHEYEETRAVYSTRRGRARYRAVFGELSKFARLHSKLLDVGCNDGVYTIPYCELGGVAHGIDISQPLVEKAREKARATRVAATFEVADVEEYLPKPEYDVVLMSEVLEHLRTPGLAVRNAVRGLRPGGHLVLSTPLPYSGFILEATSGPATSYATIRIRELWSPVSSRRVLPAGTQRLARRFRSCRCEN